MVEACAAGITAASVSGWMVLLSLLMVSASHSKAFVTLNIQVMLYASYLTSLSAAPFNNGDERCPASMLAELHHLVSKSPFIRGLDYGTPEFDEARKTEDEEREQRRKQRLIIKRCR